MKPYDTEDQPIPLGFGKPNLYLVTCGDIGEGQKEYEFEPFSTPAPIAVPVAPVVEPEKVPA